MHHKYNEMKASSIMYIWCFMLLLLCPGLFSQQTQRTVANQVSDAENPIQRYFPEKIYLTTDRNVYSAGDTVWLSGWVLDGITLKPTDKSRMLHVELIAPDNRIVRQAVLDADQGVACGQITLPAGMVSDGIYRLRAYTRWSLNFDENCRFDKKISIVQFKENIWDGARKVETKKYEWKRLPNGSFGWAKRNSDDEKTASANPVFPTDSFPHVDLQFLPEGGRWVAGLPNRMAFKAVATDGKGVNVSGDIIDDAGEEVTTFVSTHRGMGTVFLAPEKGKRYWARLFTGHQFELPQPDTTGVVMTIFRNTNDTLNIHFYFSPELVSKNAEFRLVAASRGVPLAEWNIWAVRTRVPLPIPTSGFFTGILRLTLITDEGVPCNERMVFIDHEDEIGFDLALTSDSGLRKLNLQATYQNGLPVQGVFTVAVTDSLVGQSSDAPNLRSQMLLSSDLKGIVEEPGWYFSSRRDSLRSAALDLVMRTHGWGGYDWKETDKTIHFVPQKDFSISGKVFNLLNRPAAGVSVTMLGQGAETIVDNTLTAADGSFSFDNLMPLENTLITLIARQRQGNSNGFGLGIELDKQMETPSPKISPIQEYGRGDLWNNLTEQYRRKKLDEDRFLDSLLRISDRDTHIIEEVTITGVRPVKGSWNLNGPGMADRILYQEDIARYDRYDRLLDIIKAEFPQLNEENWSNDELLQLQNGKSCSQLGNILQNWIDDEKNESLRDMYLDWLNSLTDLRLLHHFPVWKFVGRPVLFIFNGRALPVYFPANDTLKILPHPESDEMLLMAKEFWNISAKDIAGIELMNSAQYTGSYDLQLKKTYQPEMYKLIDQVYGTIMNKRTPIVNLPTAERIFLETKKELDWIYASYHSVHETKGPVIIEITTHSGISNLNRTRIGTSKLSMRGFNVPRHFYVPKYYPDSIFDQVEFDSKPVLYWNPEALTGSDGTAVIQFPVGQKPRELQIRVEGIDLRGGIGSVMQGVVSK